MVVPAGNREASSAAEESREEVSSSGLEQAPSPVIKSREAAPATTAYFQKCFMLLPSSLPACAVLFTVLSSCRSLALASHASKQGFQRKPFHSHARRGLLLRESGFPAFRICAGQRKRHSYYTVCPGKSKRGNGFNLIKKLEFFRGVCYNVCNKFSGLVLKTEEVTDFAQGKAAEPQAPKGPEDGARAFSKGSLNFCEGYKTMKIMLLTAATGGGHIRTANAIEQYIRDNTPYDVTIVDTLKAVGRLLDKTVCDSGPDAIITTHPFATEMAAALKADGLVKAPLICIITDYGAHRAYIAKEVDAYVVAGSHMLPELAAFGVPEEKVYPFGIPVHGVFFDKSDQAMLLRQLNLSPETPTLLFMAGSFGVNNIIRLYRELVATSVPMQIIVITGRNKKLYEAFEKEVAQESQVPTRLLYFTDEVEKYMHAADLLVTKPGGLTVSEALACNLPMAVFDAIPGQEEDNANFLLTHDMCVRVQKDGDFAGEISALLQEKQRLSAMRENCREFDKSQSIPNLLALIERLAGQETGQ